jgi:hypothetical protein
MVALERLAAVALMGLSLLSVAAAADDLPQ